MQNDMYDYIDSLERQLQGLPPRKEYTLSEDSFLTIEEVAKRAVILFNLQKEVIKGK